jgi:DNA-dependent RNA polymerase auxiliary subunit epsilon
MRCDPFLSDVYKGELYWLTVPKCWCPEYSPGISRAHCNYEGVELQIPISKRILDALMEIATNRKEQAQPALYVELKTSDRVPQPMPHAIAFHLQMITPLSLEEIQVIGSEKAENSSPYIVLEPHEVAKILKEAKYFEEIRIALEINALESAGPLETAVKDLKNAF